MTSYIVFDFETTGLNPYHDNIIEYTFLGNMQHITSLINPKKILDDKIIKITGITNEMVSNKPAIENKSNEIFEFIKHIFNTKPTEGPYIYLIAHNNDGFDKFFFKRMFKDNSEQREFIHKHVRFIDTIHLAKYVLPSMRSVKLKTLCKIFNIEEGTHRSYTDTVALMEVYKKLLNEFLKYNNDYSYSELLEDPSIIYDHIYYN